MEVCGYICINRYTHNLNNLCRSLKCNSCKGGNTEIHNLERGYKLLGNPLYHSTYLGVDTVGGWLEQDPAVTSGANRDNGRLRDYRRKAGSLVKSTIHFLTRRVTLRRGV